MVSHFSWWSTCALQHAAYSWDRDRRHWGRWQKLGRSPPSQQTYPRNLREDDAFHLQRVASRTRSGLSYCWSRCQQQCPVHDSRQFCVPCSATNCLECWGCINKEVVKGRKKETCFGKNSTDALSKRAGGTAWNAIYWLSSFFYSYTSIRNMARQWVGMRWCGRVDGKFFAFLHITALGEDKETVGQVFSVTSQLEEQQVTGKRRMGVSVWLRQRICWFLRRLLSKNM